MVLEVVLHPAAVAEHQRLAAGKAPLGVAAADEAGAAEHAREPGQRLLDDVLELDSLFAEQDAAPSPAESPADELSEVHQQGVSLARATLALVQHLIIQRGHEGPLGTGLRCPDDGLIRVGRRHSSPASTGDPIPRVWLAVAGPAERPSAARHRARSARASP